jgi:multidrug efflux system outer membrane protein
MKHVKLLLLPAVSAIFLLPACSLAPSYERPALVLPDVADSVEAEAIDVQWWRRFNDPLLNELVPEALRHNQDILAARERLEQAAALVGLSVGDFFPRPDASYEGGKQQLSSRATGGPPPNENQVANYSVNAHMSWELDFRGKYHDAWHSARASQQASAADRDALTLLVVGNVVKAYSALLTARQQVQIAEATVSQREQAERLQRNNVEIGGNDEMELLRVRGELARARYSLHMADLRQEQAASALALLLGRSPAQIMANDAFATPSGSPEMLQAHPLPATLPFKLLEQRPDLRAAEYDLMAEHFNIGVIRANYLPSIGIDASFGAAAAIRGNVGAAHSTTWSVLGVLSLPLDFWNTHFQELMSEARCRELAHAYEQAVRNAFGDVRNALSALNRLELAGEALGQMESTLTRAATVARNRYRYGYANYMDVLDADRSLLDARLDLAEHKNSRIAAEVDLYMALGGGWDDNYMINLETATPPAPAVVP